MTRTRIRTKTNRGSGEDSADFRADVHPRRVPDREYRIDIHQALGEYVGEIEILKPGTNTPAGCAAHAASAEAAV
jgi:hypothetical protein